MSEQGNRDFLCETRAPTSTHTHTPSPAHELLVVGAVATADSSLPPLSCEIAFFSLRKKRNERRPRRGVRGGLQIAPCPILFRQQTCESGQRHRWPHDSPLWLRFACFPSPGIPFLNTPVHRRHVNVCHHKLSLELHNDGAFPTAVDSRGSKCHENGGRESDEGSRRWRNA